MADVEKTVVTKLVIDDTQAKQAMSDYSKASKNAEAQTKRSTDAQEEYNSALDGMVDNLDVLPAGLAQTLKGTTNLTRGMKGLRAAIAATGIGALIIALGALFAWFNRTREGQEKLAVGMAVLGQAVDVLLDLFADLGEGIYNAFNDPKEAVNSLWDTIKTNLIDRLKTVPKLFKTLGKVIESSLDFDWTATKEGIEDIAKQFTFISTGIDVDKGIAAVNEQIQIGIDKAKTAAELQRLRNQLVREQTEWLTKEAELETEIADARLIANDQTKSLVERTEAMNTANEKTNQLFAGRKTLLQTEVSILQQQQALGYNRTEDMQEMATLKQELIRLDKSESDAMRELLERTNSLKNEEAARYEAKRQAEQDLHDAKVKRDEQAFESLQTLYDEQEVAEANRIRNASTRAQRLIEIEQNRLNILLENEDLTYNERLLAEAEFQTKKNEIETEAAKANLEIYAKSTQDKIEKNEFMHAAIRDAARTDTKLGKVLAVADVLISTSKGIMTTVGTLGMPLAIPFIALIAKQSADSISDIMSVPIASMGMLIKGNSHANGGVMINAEGGEGIINKKSMADPNLRRLASDINVAGGGIPFYARGGIVGKGQGQVSLLGIEDEFLRALKKAPPVLVTEDLHSTLNRVSVSSDIASL